MDQQTSFTDYEYDNRSRRTRREQFLASMDEMIPWQDWVGMIEPYYPKGTRGRKPIGIETMLRMYLMQNWFGLSDAGVEDAVYDSYAMKNFLGIDFTHEQVPDATIVRAPSSTKNKDKARDPEMHQTKKGNQWHFGMKIHSGVDAGTGYVHTIMVTAANTHDIVETHHLVREDDHTVYADSGYLGIEKRDEIKHDEHLSQVEYRIAARPSQNRLTNRYNGFNWDKKIEHDKSSVRCKVEHPFHIVKNFFHCAKTRYRGLKKNLHMFHILFASANLLMCARSGRQKDFCLAIG